jgi:hypothetical protein
MSTNRFAQGLAALSLFALAASVHAQRAALVSDVDTPIRVPYQETVTGSCQFLTCPMFFSPVATGRRREVDFVSCELVTGASSSIYYVELKSLAAGGASYGPTPRIFLPVTVYPGPAGAGRYSTTANVLAFYAAGTIPMVEALTSTTLQEVYCTMSGREVAI